MTSEIKFMLSFRSISTTNMTKMLSTDNIKMGVIAINTGIVRLSLLNR